MVSSAVQPRTDTAVSRTVLAFALAAFGSGTSQRVMDAMLPGLATEFGQSLAAVAAVVTAFTLAYSVGQLLFGPAGDRHGKLRVVAWSCVGCCAGALACAFSESLSMLVAARAAAGLMAAPLVPLAMAWIGDVIPYEQRQPVLARFLIGQILGVSAGQLLGGLAVDHLGRQLPFVGIALVFALSAMALMRAHRHFPSPPPSRLDAHPLRHLLSEFAAVLDAWRARVVLLSVFLEGAAVFGALAFFATHLHQRLGLSLTASGASVMGFGFGGLLFALAAPQLLRRLGERGLVLWGGLLLMLAMLGVAFAPGVWLAVSACFGMGVGFYMFHNTLQTHATQMAPARRGAAVALFSLAYFGGQTAGVAAGAVASQWLGTGGVIGLSACMVMLVSGGFAAVALRWHPNHPE